MPANDYHFVTHWLVEGTIDEVSAVLSDPGDLVRWWPSVYLAVDVLEAGDESGLGREVSLYTKGWLPYTLRWQFRVTEINDNGFTLAARGDFVGTGTWTFVQEGRHVSITYDWWIEANKPLLRVFSFALKPLFAANHLWAMARGEESLRLELARRRASSSQERDQVPDPPAATTTSVLPLLSGVLGGLLFGLVVWKAARRS